MQQQFVSFNPDDAVQGGFSKLQGDEEVVIISARVCMNDYNQTRAAVPVMELTYEYDALEEGVRETTIENYSMGSAGNWAPSEDGKRATIVSTKAKGLSDNCKTVIFFTHLVNIGFPKEKITDDVSILVGLKGVTYRVPAPKVKDKQTGEEKETTVLVLRKILQFPWDVDATAGKGKSKGKGKVTANTGSGDPVEEEVEQLATGFVLDLLSSNPNGVRKADLPRLAFSHASLKSDCGVQTATRNKIFLLVNKDDFLTGSPLWRYGKETQGMVLSLE